MDGILEALEREHEVFRIANLRLGDQVSVGIVGWNRRRMVHMNLVISLSGDEQLFRKERAYVTKINNVLVQIVKHDWPHRWPSFIPDLVVVAKIGEWLSQLFKHFEALIGGSV